MSKTISKFRFKQFSVSHHRSSMKVGVDGVLIGCWAEVNDASHIIDVGTGCGIIALIMAQRTLNARIDAIDVDSMSVEEASENVALSPWSDRIRVLKVDYSELIRSSAEKYDLIVSNPPFFDSGITEIHTSRERARHQVDLSPSQILADAAKVLTDGGSVAIVVPTEFAESLEYEATAHGFSLTRKCLVRGHDKAPYKRVLLQWRLNEKGKEQSVLTYLTLEESPSVPTDEYRTLCKDFYLKF